VNFPGTIYARGKTIKIVVTDSASTGIQLLAECDFRAATIQYSGTMAHLVAAQMAISNFRDASFVEDNRSPEELTEQRRSEILARLAEIDAAGIRPMRAIAEGEAVQADHAKLAALDGEAAELRTELAGLA
jgi:hypothetical protein